MVSSFIIQNHPASSCFYVLGSFTFLSCRTASLKKCRLQKIRKNVFLEQRVFSPSFFELEPPRGGSPILPFSSNASRSRHLHVSLGTARLLCLFSRRQQGQNHRISALLDGKSTFGRLAADAAGGGGAGPPAPATLPLLRGRAPAADLRGKPALARARGSAGHVQFRRSAHAGQAARQPPEGGPAGKKK